MFWKKSKQPKRNRQFQTGKFQLQAEGLDYASTSASVKSLITTKFEQSRTARNVGKIEESRDYLISAIKAIYESTQK